MEPMGRTELGAPPGAVTPPPRQPPPRVRTRRALLGAFPDGFCSARTARSTPRCLLLLRDFPNYLSSSQLLSCWLGPFQRMARYYRRERARSVLQVAHMSRKWQNSFPVRLTLNYFFLASSCLALRIRGRKTSRERMQLPFICEIFCCPLYLSPETVPDWFSRFQTHTYFIIIMIHISSYMNLLLISRPTASANVNSLDIQQKLCEVS